MRAYLQLFRAPLAATAVSNVWIAGALAGGDADWFVWALLGVASVALYWAGMALNDVFDRERDAHLYPKRPLPSGAIGVGLAAGLGAGLLVTGVCAATLAGALAGNLLAGLLGGVAVAVCVLLYDGLLKRWRHPGAVAMGACRAANAGLGVAVLGDFSDAPLGWGYAAALGLYVYALTVLSTYEDEAAPRSSVLGVGAVLLALPVATAIFCMREGSSDPPRALGALGCALFLAVIWSQLIDLLVHGTLARGQATTRNLLHALWLLDLSAFLLGAPWLLGLPCAALYVASRLGIRALFRPPPTAPASD